MTCLDRDARHADGLAPQADCDEVGSFRQTRARAPTDHVRHCRTHRSHGAHWEVLAATDFFTVEVWTLQGLLTHYVLFFIELATRSVYVTEITTNPNELFMRQIARNLTDVVDGFFLDKRYLILDRDTKTHRPFEDFWNAKASTSYDCLPDLRI